MWKHRLKRYDKLLFSQKKLDGSLEIYRQSPFNKRKKHLVMTIQNQLAGSWIIDKLMMMDMQRKDVAGSVLRNNLRIRNTKDDSRITREIAEMFATDGAIFVN